MGDNKEVATGGGGVMDTSRLLSPGSNVTSPKRRPQIVATRREISETLTAYSEESDDGIKRFFGSRRKHHHRKHMRRAVEKGGHTNVQYKNISKRRRRFISDIYTTMVDAPCVIDLVRWIQSLLMFAMSFYTTWLTFASLYYVICWHHGDLEEDHLPHNQEASGWKPCVLEIENFASAFMFSLETQHTIGYGSRQVTNLCPAAMVVTSIQSISGCLIQAFMVGLVFAKLSKPSRRSKTVIFSEQAVVNERDGKLCLSFRVGDMRDDSFIVGTQLSAKVIRRRSTQEGEMYHDIKAIKIHPETSCEPCVLLIWPLTLIHVIDEESPFYELSASEVANDKFEIVVCLEGTIESTSMTFQARTSFLPNEIHWGHRFEPMMLYRKDTNNYQVNFSAFNSTYEVDTPLCSARDLDAYNQMVSDEDDASGQEGIVLKPVDSSRGGVPASAGYGMQGPPNSRTVPGSVFHNLVNNLKSVSEKAAAEPSELKDDGAMAASAAASILMDNLNPTTTVGSTSDSSEGVGKGDEDPKESPKTPMPPPSDSLELVNEKASKKQNGQQDGEACNSVS